MAFFNTPPSAILLVTVSPLIKCNAWERLGSIFTSHEQTVARVARPERYVLAPGEVVTVLEPRIADLLDESSWRQEEWGGFNLWFRPFPEGMLWGATARMVRALLGYFRV